MSGIFDLFGGTGNAAKQQTSLGPTEIAKKSATNSTMFGGGMAAKNDGLNRSKPKGLSIRSGNELNIKDIKSSKSPTKKSPIKGFFKRESNQFDGSQQLSPRNKAKTLKMQIMRSKQLKASKTKSPEADLTCDTKQKEVYIFKKPTTPKKRTEKMVIYPEPEKLANYYDYAKDLEDYKLDTEFLELLKLNNPIKPYNDEGFESDPETTRPSSASDVNVFVASYDDVNIPATLDLPAISDDEDFWN